MSSQPKPKRKLARWTISKGSLDGILFLAITAVVEYIIVLYAISLGVTDASVLQWSFQFPGTSWTATIAVSLIFHLVPICVILVLGFSWIYLTKRITSRKQEMRKGRAEHLPKQFEKKGFRSTIIRATGNFSRKIQTRFSRFRGVSYFSKRITSSRAIITSSLIILLAFLVFTLLFSILAYPQLIFRTVTNAYQANPSLRNFVASVDTWAGGAAQALGPIGWLSTTINNGILSASPGVRDVGHALGGLTGSLATLDGAGKFLVFQNAAAAISVLIVLVYGERAGKGYRYRK